MASRASTILNKPQYNKLIPLRYSTNDGVLHESLISFQETDGTFSLVKLNNHKDTVVSCSTTIEPLPNLASSSLTLTKVSAFACSNDGQRIAIGYKDGSTRIFSFTAESLMLSSTSGVHPFFLSGSSRDDTNDDDEEELNYVAGPRFQSCVRDLAFDPRSSSANGYFLAAASEDFNCGVCIVNLSDMSERYLVECSSGYGGVRSLAYTPTVDNDTVLLAALGMDGKLTFYTCMGLDQPDLYWDMLHHETVPVIPIKDTGEMMTAAATSSPQGSSSDEPVATWSSKAAVPVWSADGAVLAIPGSTDVQLRLRGDVTKKYYLYSSAVRKEGHFLGDIVACTLHQEILVSVGRDGSACVWKLDQTVKRLLQDPSLDNNKTTLGNFHKALTPPCDQPTSVAFITGSNTSVCIQSATGECYIHSDLLASTISVSKDESSFQHGARKTASKVLEDNESDQESTQFDTQPIRKPNIFVDAEAKDDEDESLGEHSLNEVLSTGSAVSEGLDTHVYQDDFPNEDDDVEFKEDNFENRSHYSYPKPQEAFAPSSTPLHDDTIDARRILCWNHVGVVTSRNDAVRGGRIIDINFTDVLTGGGFKTFSDSYGFEIGSLSEEGSIFATFPEDNDTGSRIYYFRFETIGLQNKKDWTMILPDGEGVLGCACGEGWAAVVTSRRFLRLFGSGGMQRSILCLKGSPVTMAGRGRLLAVVYHESVPLPDKTQQLGFMLLDGVDGETICTGSLTAVGCGQKLSWIGFSNDYALTVMDSGGMLSMLNKLAGWQWTPMLDTLGKKKSDDDLFWPVTVLDGKLLCVPLKGGHEHPDATRRPVTTALDLRMPMANSTLKKSFQLEETCARASVSLVQKSFVHDLLRKEGEDPVELEEDYTRSCAQIDKVTLRLFHESLQANLYERALDVVSRLHLEKSFDIALTISEQFRSRALLDRIELIKIARFASLESHEGAAEESKLTDIEERCRLQSVEYGSRRISPDSQNLIQTSGNKRKSNEDNDVDSTESDVMQLTTPSKVMHPQPKLNPFFVREQFSSPKKVVNKRIASVDGAASSPRPHLFRNSTFSFKSKEETRTRKKFL